MSKFVWAKKVPRELIRRLYESDAAAIPDEELADEVGWALYTRCDAIVNVTECYELGRLRCPECWRELTLTDEHFICGCGFGADWDEFRRSYRAKQLYGANALPFFKRYLSEFPRAESFGEKLIAIDTLIHSFHVLHSYRLGDTSPDPYDENNRLGRPAAANLIEGSLSEVVRFLDELSERSGIEPAESERHRAALKRANGANR